MPLYDFRCEDGHTREEYRSYEKRDDPAACECGKPLTRVWLPPQVMRDIEGYQSMVDGSWIGSRSQHREHLKRHGMRELGNEKPDFTKRGPTVPRDSIRREIKTSVERMKAEGKWRVR
jgi:putative FmdB family regulatory protein